MRKSLICLVLVVFLFSSVQAPVGLSEVAKAPTKVDPNAPASMSVAGNRLQVSKWGGFSTVSVEMPSIEGFTDYEYRVSDVPEGKEVDLILYKAPKTNVFYYPIAVKNANFYYQPALTAEEIAEGCIRPDNVVGSYAVYGPKKDNEYGTGKIAHIFRPKVVAADGSWIWGVLDYKDGVLSVTVDPTWLSKAVYPVTIDPTFGYTTAGGSETSFAANILRGDKATGVAGTVVAVVAYIKKDSGSNFKGVLVKVADKLIVTNGVTSAKALPAAYAWTAATFLTNPTSTAQDYYICVIADGSVSLKYDVGANLGFYDSTNSYTNPQNPTDGSVDSARFSVYVIYNPSTADAPTIAGMDDSDNVYAMKNYYSMTEVVHCDQGADKISAVAVKFVGAGGALGMVKVTGLLTGAPTWSVISGQLNITSGSCTWNEAGNDGTAVFSFEVQWDFPQEDNVDLVGSILDIYNYNATNSTATDYVDMITRLTTYQFGANNTSPSISKPITLSGFVRYCTSATGASSSTSYPPNAQFTSVSVYDDEDTLQGTNATITNGAFSINITSSPIIKTTAYHAWFDMVPDYTDGAAPDGDLVYVSTVASFYFADQIIDAFNNYGMAFTGVTDIIGGLAGYFNDAAADMLSLLIQMITLTAFVTGSVIFWLTRFVNFFIFFFTLFGDMMEGGGSLATEWGNIWDFIGFDAWLGAIPVFVVVFWMYGLDERSSKTGRGHLDLMVGDLQVVLYLVGVVWEWTSTVFNVTLNLLMSFAGLITG